MPLLQTPSAAHRRRMLGDEDGMVSHGRLFAIVGRVRWSESLINEIAGVKEDCRKAFGLEVGEFFASQSETRAELRPAESDQ